MASPQQNGLGTRGHSSRQYGIWIYFWAGQVSRQANLQVKIIQISTLVLHNEQCYYVKYISRTRRHFDRYYGMYSCPLHDHSTTVNKYNMAPDPLTTSTSWDYHTYIHNWKYKKSQKSLCHFPSLLFCCCLQLQQYKRGIFKRNSITIDYIVNIIVSISKLMMDARTILETLFLLNEGKGGALIISKLISQDHYSSWEYRATFSSFIKMDRQTWLTPKCTFTHSFILRYRGWCEILKIGPFIWTRAHLAFWHIIS